jgi:hypothetical protein
MGSTSLKVNPLTTIEFGAYANCGSDVWRFKVTKCEAQIKQAVRLCPNQTPVTSALISSTTDCDVLKQMKNSLNKIANQEWTCGGNYYTLAAVQAHEDVHKADIINGCNTAFATFKAAVEALTIYRGGCDPAAAVSIFTTQSSGYTAARSAMLHAIEDAIQASAAKDGVTGGQMSQAEHAVVDPLIEQINQRLQSLGCP